MGRIREPRLLQPSFQGDGGKNPDIIPSAQPPVRTRPIRSAEISSVPLEPAPADRQSREATLSICSGLWYSCEKCETLASDSARGMKALTAFLGGASMSVECHFGAHGHQRTASSRVPHGLAEGRVLGTESISPLASVRRSTYTSEATTASACLVGSERDCCGDPRHGRVL